MGSLDTRSKGQCESPTEKSSKLSKLPPSKTPIFSIDLPSGWNIEKGKKKKNLEADEDEL